MDERQASIVEMRYFGGMTVPEVAEALGVSVRTVEGEWTHAKAWLKRELSAASAPSIALQWSRAASRRASTSGSRVRVGVAPQVNSCW